MFRGEGLEQGVRIAGQGFVRFEVSKGGLTRERLLFAALFAEPVGAAVAGNGEQPRCEGLAPVAVAPDVLEGFQEDLRGYVLRDRCVPDLCEHGSENKQVVLLEDVAPRLCIAAFEARESRRRGLSGGPGARVFGSAGAGCEKCHACYRLSRRP